MSARSIGRNFLIIVGIVIATALWWLTFDGCWFLFGCWV